MIMFEDAEKLLHRANRVAWYIDMLKQERLSLEATLSEYEKSLSNLRESSLAVSKAVEDTHRCLETSIVDVVNKALAVVFDEPYEMSLKVSQRGTVSKTTQINIVLSKNGVVLEKNLSESVEGGVLAVVSIIMRIAFLLLKQDNRNILLLDEALGSLSRVPSNTGESNLEKAANMLAKLSEMFGIQMVVISHTGVGE